MKVAIPPTSYSHRRPGASSEPSTGREARRDGADRQRDGEMTRPLQPDGGLLFVKVGQMDYNSAKQKSSLWCVPPEKVYERGGYGHEPPKGLSDKDVTEPVEKSLRRTRRNR